MNEATMESGTDVNRLSEVHSISGRTLKSGSQGTSLKGRWWSGACAVRGGAAGSRNIQSVRTLRDPHAATSHISRATSTLGRHAKTKSKHWL